MRTSFAMANVKVAVRVRPLSKKEEETGSSFILDVSENVLSIVNLKVEGPATDGDRHRQRVRHFTFDFCYLSADKSRPDYASQELVSDQDFVFTGFNNFWLLNTYPRPLLKNSIIKCKRATRYRYLVITKYLYLDFGEG
ncbi:kinesin-like protein KIF16B [Anneissia japonica]|uniref:kinesin-like protein KIF16B n=1 Tax=Anneissia japonica TaxID=1529436 RepID=UPI0014255D5C|nr:kinesin-like protein KIF16B [Anneissia japonica]